jgi:hypothetical protein
MSWLPWGKSVNSEATEYSHADPDRSTDEDRALEERQRILKQLSMDERRLLAQQKLLPYLPEK